MKLTIPVLSVLAATFVLINPPAKAQDLDWEKHYCKAEKAYASHNLFEARHEFLLALKEAEQCQQHAQLTQRLETLASNYQAQDNSMLAQPLFKLARKLRSKVM